MGQLIFEASASARMVVMSFFSMFKWLDKIIVSKVDSVLFIGIKKSLGLWRMK